MPDEPNPDWPMTISVAPLSEVPAFRGHRTGGPGTCSSPPMTRTPPSRFTPGADTKDLPRGDWPGLPIWDETFPCSSGPDRNHHKSDNCCSGGGMHHAVLPDVPKTKD